MTPPPRPPLPPFAALVPANPAKLPRPSLVADAPAVAPPVIAAFAPPVLDVPVPLLRAASPAEPLEHAVDHSAIPQSAPRESALPNWAGCTVGRMGPKCT